MVSVERFRLSPHASSAKLSLRSRAINSIPEKYLPGMMERVSERLFHWSGTENISQLEPHLKEGAHLWIVMSHQSQAEVSASVQVARMVQEQFPKELERAFYVVAKSMGTGEQGGLVKRLYTLGAGKYFSNNNITPIEVVSENDVTMRGLSPDYGAVLRLKRAAKEEKSAIMVHVEGTMKPGRINPDTGKIFGMGDMDKNFQKLISDEIKRRNLVFLPVGIHGSYEILDPERKKFTKKGLEEIALSEIAYLYGVPTSPIAQVRIGEPFQGADIKDNPVPEIMRRIAELLPRNARGIYK